MLFESYADALVAAAFDDGIVTIADAPDSGVLPREFMLMRFLEGLRLRHNPHKSYALQALLLSERVLLVDPSPLFDYVPLEKTGFVQVSTHYDAMTALPPLVLDPPTVEYAMLLKPIVLDYLCRQVVREERSRIRAFGLTANALYSALFDLAVSRGPHDDAAMPHSQPWEYVIERVRERYSKHRFHYSAHGMNRSMAFRLMVDEWYLYVTFPLHRLMSLLDLSAHEGAILLQNQFRMPRTGTPHGISIDAPSRYLLQSYGILSACLEKSIGYLPRLRSLRDVLRLKEHRHKDIRSLRMALAEVEAALREGKSSAIAYANHSLQVASADLARGNTLDTVSRWATYFSLPVTVVEGLLRIPPIAGITCAAVGAFSALTSQVAITRSRWLQLVR